MKLRLQILWCLLLDGVLGVLIVLVGVLAVAVALVEGFFRAVCQSLGLSERWVNPLTNSLIFIVGAMILINIILSVFP
jgi:hypothetical protein